MAPKPKRKIATLHGSGPTSKKQKPADTSHLFKVVPRAVGAAKSKTMFKALSAFVLEKTNGAADTIKPFGKDIKEPRLKTYCSRVDAEYEYSRATHVNRGWPKELDELCELATALCGDQLPFTRAVINLYRDGNDSIGAHRDADAKDAYIVSFSFYEQDDGLRYLTVRHSPERGVVVAPHGPKVDSAIAKVPMPQGSAILMLPGMQQLCKHEVRKQKNACPRINVTLRR